MSVSSPILFHHLSLRRRSLQRRMSQPQPAPSIYSLNNDSRSSLPQLSNSPPPPTHVPPQPSIALLFSHMSRRDVWVYLVPSIIVAVIGGGIAPFMTQVIGQVFDAFARFPLTPNPPQEAKDRLLRESATCGFQLLGLGVGTLIHSSILASLWMWVGERNALQLRKLVYDSVTSRPMEWFDIKLGANQSEGSSPSSTDKKEDTIEVSGAGGMMAQFASDTDEVRMATSLNAGMLIQYIVTFITCLVLALIRSWSLTLVILSSIPLLVIIQGVSQALAIPLYNAERQKSSQAGTYIERAISSISTVKAFNAAKREAGVVSNIVYAAKAAYTRCCIIWATTAGLTQFILFAMFVSGFWYGSKLVRDGSITPGQVMGVFWACLIASSNLQLCVPLLVVLTKGKTAAVSLELLINPPPTPPPQSHTSVAQRPISSNTVIGTTIPLTPISPTRKFRFASIHQQRMTKIIPQGKCYGSIHMHNLQFSYPSRPDVPVLQVEDLYLPHGETTFIVGGSGSGKSTIAQLLLRMYEPMAGSILFDDQELAHLDKLYTSTHIAAVSQATILFDMTVHENVAMGFAGSGKKLPSEATKEEVMRACRAALMHDFVRDLPEGYDTRLGNGGASLSGGQRQRLAIARAILRDPTVLILDEATSALDATSRLLVFEAIKQWRKNRTTIVITHDLSQIAPEDFVYVVKNGKIVEQGYRSALEAERQGEFRAMSDKQSSSGGFPVKDLDDDDDDDDEGMGPENDVEPEEEEYESDRRRKRDTGATAKKAKHRSSFARWISGIGSSGKHTSTVWMLDAVADLTGNKSSAAIQAQAAQRAKRNTSSAPPPAFFNSQRIPALPNHLQLPGSEYASRPSFQATGLRDAIAGPNPQDDQDMYVRRRSSLPFEPVSPTTTTFGGGARQSTWAPRHKQKGSDEDEDVEDDEEFEREKNAMQMSGAAASRKRPPRSLNDGPLPGAKIGTGRRINHSTANVQLDSVAVGNTGPGGEMEVPPSLFKIAQQFYPTLPNKPLVLVGILFSLANGAMTPVFSFLLARLMAEVGAGAQNVSTITFYAMFVLLIALGDGITGGLKFFVMETAAMGWVASLRTKAYSLILHQDKAWFDSPVNSPERIVQVIVKDGDDARMLVSTVLAQSIVVFSMVNVGLIWAMVKGWQLTLVGIGIGPVFAFCMMLSSVFTQRFEVRNKRAREDVARKYFDAVSNVRAVRSMGFEQVFATQFNEALQVALKTGVRGAMVSGSGYGVANAMVYSAQALLYYVGAVMMVRGTYTYLQLLEVMNLVVFSVSIAAQIMSFVPKVAKSKQAAFDLGKLLQLDTQTAESKGDRRFTIQGDISFRGVKFAYPERSDVPVLKDISFTIRDGECVAVVGASGSGKSTIAALLQRFYQPSSGSIRVGRYDLADADVVWLRSHVAVVSQQAALFDASIKDNIVYGADAESIPFHEVQRAARDANLDSFIQGLPQGYDTMLGEKAALISGGQAQRLQIARALVNGKANILIFDEATSALDVDNQEAVMSTVLKVREGRTTVIVTHKLPVMRVCDRILVVDDGKIVEEGSYNVLMAKKGTFHKLLSAGEWSSE